MNTFRRLTASEELMAVDDRPAYPACFFIRLRFSGRLDRTAFESAVAGGLQRHPLLRALVVERWNRLEWRLVDDSKPQITWINGPAVIANLQTGRIDLRREVGIRFHVTKDEAGVELLIQCHHAACDGRGLLQVTEDVLIAYAAICNGTQAPFRAGIDVEVLPRVDPFRLLPSLADGFRHGWTTVRRAPAPILPHLATRDSLEPGCDYPAGISETLSATETAAVFDAAKRLRVTVNDLLLASAFLAVDDWRKAYGFDRDNWIRVLAPADMRTCEQRRCPAGNIVSGYFLDRCAADLEDPERALMDVHREMNLSKKRRFAHMFLLATKLCRYLPGGLRKQVLANKCLVSLFLTNPGRLFETTPLTREEGRLVAGDVALQSVEFLPPIRPYACANFAATTYADELTLTLHYDLRPLSHSRGRGLLNALIDRVRSWSAKEVEDAARTASFVS